MLTPQQTRSLIHQSIQRILGRSVHIDPADRLVDVGVEGPRLYSLCDLISLEVRQIGHRIDPLVIRGHLQPNSKVSALCNLVQTRAFSPVPGGPGPIPAPIYICPQGDFVWARYSAGIPVPNCPYDGNALVKK
jgi:hypothetical protein